MSESGHRSCECGAVYDRSEHIAEAREISSFECVVCGKTIENWNSAWVPRLSGYGRKAGLNRFSTGAYSSDVRAATNFRGAEKSRFWLGG
jgi:hypothetical protein